MVVCTLRRVLCGSLIVALALVGSGCASAPTVVPTGMLEADKYLYQRGTELLGKKKWISSREYFRQIVDNYPQSAFRPEAKLGVGDSLLGEGSAEALVLAQNEFKEFLTFFPTHARADYAQFKLGMTHYHQMLAPDRDQAETKEAVSEFNAFLLRYPNSSLMPEVKAKLRDARSRLSESDYKVGYYYWRVRWYPGAVERLRAVLAEDPEYPRRDAVYFHLADSFYKIGNRAAALPYFDRLIKEFEKSQYLVESQKYAAEIKAQMAAQAK